MGSRTQLSVAQVSLPARVALASVGFTATVAQIVLLRELLTASSGNELSLGLSLAMWLAWTAFGSHFPGQLFSGHSSRKVFALLLVVAAFALPLAILLVRFSRVFWGASPGEILGPFQIVATACASLALFCPVSGCLFTAGSQLYAELSENSPDDGASSMYLLESIGSSVGGILASIVLIRLFSSLQIAAVLATVNILLAISIRVRHRPSGISFALAFAAGVSATLVAHRCEVPLTATSWPGFHIVTTESSPYGDLAVVQTEGNRCVVQNGTVMFTSPDVSTAEDAVHFALLEHPEPKSVLLVGGGLGGSIEEVLKHSSLERLDYVELDPAVIRLGRTYFPRNWSALSSDGRVDVHEMDGRLFVRSTRRKFDVVIINLPEPETAQLNRFYTEEFFREVRSILAPRGVFSFQVRASEEYLSPTMKEFLRCLDATLRGVFADVVAIPGETMHFIASQQRGTLTDDPSLLVRRLNERHIPTSYFRDYYLLFRMSSERMSELKENLRTQSETRINRDFVPVAYFFNIELWSTQYSNRYRAALDHAASLPFRSLALGALLVTLLLAVILARVASNAGQGRFAAGYSTLVMGLTLMGSEILLLLGFQAVYGYVFGELALIVAGFMAGISIGAWLALRTVARSKQLESSLVLLILVQASSAILLLCETPLIAALGNLRTPMVTHLGFLISALLFGTVGGFQFPIAMRVFTFGATDKLRSPGPLYSLDLVGASLGAIAISVFVLPLFGFLRTAQLVVLVNLGPVLLCSVLLVRTTFSLARVRDR